MADETIRVVTPSQLSESEFAAVHDLIAVGGEVRISQLAEHLSSSRRIALIEVDGKLACVGAIKDARPNYVLAIARKSGYALDAENCVGEYGYVASQVLFRNRGLARALSTELLKDIEDSLYATTRDDNPAIHTIVRDNGFMQVRMKWRSSQHPESSLMLWIRKRSEGYAQRTDSDAPD